MPDARLRKTREVYTMADLFKGCICASLALNGDVIPEGAVWQCPEHPERTFMRGPSGMAS